MNLSCRMRRTLAFIASTTILALAATSRADDSAVTPLSPAMDEAIGRLNADDFHDRQKALSQLEDAICRQTLALMDVDDEQTPQIQTALDFQLGISRWALRTLEYPSAQRKTLFSPAQSAGFATVLGQAYADRVDVRMKAIHRMAEFPDQLIQQPLAELIRSDDAATAITAMDVAYSRPLSPPMIGSLFYRAVEQNFAPARPGATEMEVRFQGERIETASPAFAISQTSTEGIIAFRVLVHAHPQKLAPFLESFFEDMLTRMHNPTDLMAKWRYTANNKSYAFAGKLAGLTADPHLLPILYKVGTDPQPLFMANTLYFTSSRTPAIAAILQINGIDPRTRGLRHLDRMHPDTELPPDAPDGIWTFGKERDEAAVIQSLPALPSPPIVK